MQQAAVVVVDKVLFDVSQLLADGIKDGHDTLVGQVENLDHVLLGQIPDRVDCFLGTLGQPAEQNIRGGLGCKVKWRVRHR